MSAPEVRLAMIGTGAWAEQVHFPAVDYIRRHHMADFSLRLRGICSLDREGAKRAAVRYRFERIYADLTELLDDPQIDVIALVVKPAQLAGILERLSVKGVPVLMEKPPGAGSMEAERLSQSFTLPHIVAFNRRFAPMNVRFRERAEKLSAPYFVEAQFYRNARVDNLFVRETCIHMLDLVTYCFGPVTRASTLRMPHPSAPTSNWIVDAQFESGLLAQLQFFPCSGMRTERILVHSATETLALQCAEIKTPTGRLVAYGNELTVASSAPAVDLTQAKTQALDHSQTEFLDAADSPAIVTCGFVAEYQELFGLARGIATSRSTITTSFETMRLAEAIQTGTSYRKEADDSQTPEQLMCHQPCRIGQLGRGQSQPP